MSSYEIETVRKVYDNAAGECISVGPDCDGLGLVEIDGGQHYGGCLRVPAEMALVLADAIKAAADDLLSKV